MAAGLSFSGIGSGIDFGLITDSIIAQSRRPITQLQVQKDTYNKRIDSLKKLNAGLITLKEAAAALTDQTLGSGRIASSADSSVVTATATSSASVAATTVNITRIASALVQATKSYSSTSAAVLPIGQTLATIELRKGGSATASATITIDSTNNTLTGLRDAINNAGTDITASIVDVNGDGTGNQLVLTSKDTGSTGRIELVETSASGTVADMTIRNVNSAGGGFSDLDASLSINGLSITRSTNTVSDAVSGVTFNLKKAGSTNVSVTQNSGSITEKLTAFVDAYNSIQDAINAQYVTDTSGRPLGTLSSDPALREVQQQIRGVLSTESTTNGGAFTNLTEIGVGRDEKGRLTLDSATLDDRLKNNLSDVQALLAGGSSLLTGIANSINDVATTLSDSISGTVQVAINGYTSSITNIDKSILDQEARLALLRESLTRQFAAADAAISQINGQGSSLTSIIKSFESARTKN